MGRNIKPEVDVTVSCKQKGVVIESISIPWALLSGCHVNYMIPSSKAIFHLVTKYNCCQKVSEMPSTIVLSDKKIKLTNCKDPLLMNSKKTHWLLFLERQQITWVMCINIFALT